MSYINYECTICRRRKSFIKDNQRVIPNSCMITKGCLGRMMMVEETSLPIATPTISGVEDWYARGLNHTVLPTIIEAPNFQLSTSSTGSLVVALKSATSSLPTSIILTLEQKRVGDVTYHQFQFKLTSNSSIIFGKDANGKNLRFDQFAIDEGRVTVRVNGVDSTDFDLLPNKITFRSEILSGSIVDIIIYTEKSTVVKTLTLTRNKTLVPSLTRGSWSNIDFITKREVGGALSKWYLYTTDVVAGLAAGKIRVVGNSLAADAIFLLASIPYQSTDRYLNFIINQSDLEEDFYLTHADGILTASQSLLSELFPPLILNPDAYISEDLYTSASSSVVVVDTEEERFISKKILGPV